MRVHVDLVVGEQFITSRKYHKKAIARKSPIVNFWLGLLFVIKG